MSKNAKRRLKEYQERRNAEGRLREMLAEGVLLGEDCVDLETLLDPDMTSDEEIAEVLTAAGFDPDEARGGRALIRRVVDAPRTPEELLDELDEDMLDPACPIEFVEQELRDAGLDPEKVREDGRELAGRLLAKSRVAAGTMRVRAYDVLERAVEEGVAYGWTRAHKHVEDPKPEAIREQIEREVMSAICEWFEFDPEGGCRSRR